MNDYAWFALKGIAWFALVGFAVWVTNSALPMFALILTASWSGTGKDKE